MSFKNQSGQALVLVLLSLSVVLTVVLFVLSRGVTDVAISSRQEESVRAFSAAEAGIERALVVGTSFTDSIMGYDVTVSGLATGSDFNYPVDLSSGDSATIWFVAHDSSPNFKGNSMTVCWGKSGTSSGSAQTPAIEVSVFYDEIPGNPAKIKIARSALDPNSGRRVSNSFDSVDGPCAVNGINYAFSKTINFCSGSANLGIPLNVCNSTAGGFQFAKIRMLYNSNSTQSLGISVIGGSLPSQGQNIVSTGTVGGSNRRVNVIQNWPEIPNIFEYAVYSPNGGLTK